MPEFSVQALDSLRQPLETGEVTIARANAHVRHPARVQPVAAINPCRCGQGGLGRAACGKAPRCQQTYQGRVSGPLMDRIDLIVEVPPVTAADLMLPPPSEGSAEVAAARDLQSSRAAAASKETGASPLNARAEGAWLEMICALDAPAPGTRRRSVDLPPRRTGSRRRPHAESERFLGVTLWPRRRLFPPQASA